MTLHVRIATMDDFAAVDSLLSRAYPRLLKADYPPSVLVTALPLISRAQPVLLRSGTYYVAEDATAQIVGAGGWSVDAKTKTLGHVRHVVADDRMQGRGIGRAILARVFAEAREAGLSDMECWSTRTAVRFYEAMGFRQIGPIDVPLRAGITFPSVRMHRAL